MARSVHTQPRRVRAPRRVRLPHARRGDRDPATQRSLARSLKAWGIILEPAPDSPLSEAAPLPRIRVRRPPRGYHHPLGRSEIASALRFFGEACTYGLREIELSSRPSGDNRRLQFGRLIVPGRVVLYPQPSGPWRLLGLLSEGERIRLERAGATVEILAGGLHTVVSWPERTLGYFMLFDVLLHEVGHHIVQQYTGKRRVRVARTRDHESFAESFARRCRLLNEKAHAGK